MNAIRLSLASLLFVASITAASWSKDDGKYSLHIRPGKSSERGEWRAALEVLKSGRRGGLNIEFGQERSMYSSYIPRESAPEFNGKAKDGEEISLVVSAEAGDLKLAGQVKGKFASGTYDFIENREFSGEAEKLFKREVTVEESLRLAFARVSIAFIRGVFQAGISPSVEEVVALRAHGLAPDGIKAYAAAGFSKPYEMTSLRAHGATPEYAAGVRASGYGKTAEEVTRFKAHGVKTEELEGWNAAGFKAAGEEIVRLHVHGVHPAYGAAWKKSGFDFSAEELVRLKIHGVPAEFGEALAGVDKKTSAEQAIRLKIHGVSPEFFREVKKSNPEMTIEDVVNLKLNGVSSDYVAALNAPGRTPLGASEIIDLKRRGISVETARKLRQ